MIVMSYVFKCLDLSIYTDAYNYIHIYNIYNDNIYIYSGLSSHHITCKPPMISTMFGWHPLCQGWTALCHHPHELEPQIHPTCTGKTSASASLCWWYIYMFVCVYMCLYVFICDHDSQSYIASSGFSQGFVVRISCCPGSRGMGRLPSEVAWWRDWAARMPQALFRGTS